MKFFHLSDLHIGIKLKERDLSEDQIYIFKQICEMAKAEQPDAVVIAGDIYDRSMPSAEAVELFNQFITSLNKAVPNAYIMMISGNHDNISRIDNFRNILSEQKIYMIGRPPIREDEYIEKVTMNDEYGKVNFYLLPFVKPSMIRLIVGTDENGNSLSYDEAIHRLINREDINENERNVLVSHQFYLPIGKNADEVERMESEIRSAGNIDHVNADILEKFDYAALGHIHKPMKVGSEYYRYSGTPFAYSVSEAGQQKSIIVVEMNEKGDVKTRNLELKPLHAVRVIKGLYEDVLKEASEDYVKVILTDKEDLNVIDMQDRLRVAFPRLLYIERENIRELNFDLKGEAIDEMDVFELCKAFLNDLNDEELKILQEVIDEVGGER